MLTINDPYIRKLALIKIQMMSLIDLDCKQDFSKFQKLEKKEKIIFDLLKLYSHDAINTLVSHYLKWHSVHYGILKLDINSDIYLKRH